MAGFNALYVPLHLEDLILRHPDAPVTQLLSKLPDWQDAKGLARIQQGIQQGSLAPDKHLLSREAAQQAAGVKPAGNRELFAAGNSSTAAPAVSFKGLSAVEAALWQNASWSHQTVERLFIKVHAYKAEPRQCVGFSKLRNNMLKHHEEISRMQVGLILVCLQSASILGARRSVAGPAHYTWSIWLLVTSELG